MTKIKKMVPYTSRWQSMASRLALQWVSISVCWTCGHPVIKNYQCTYCGETNPGGTPESRKEFYDWVNKKKEGKHD